MKQNLWDIYKALEEIRKANGGILRPKDVVDAARDPNHILHPYFEWDDTKAAELYRLEQARSLIRRVEIEVKIEDRKPVKVRAYVSLQDDRQKGDSYRATVEVLSQEELREKLLEEARREMEAFIKKYRTLDELAGVIQAMEEALQLFEPVPV